MIHNHVHLLDYGRYFTFIVFILLAKYCECHGIERKSHIAANVMEPFNVILNMTSKILVNTENSNSINDTQ